MSERWQVIHGDCRDVLAGMDANSVDAVVTDPPYGLEFMGKEWDKLDAGLPQEQVWKGRRGKGGSDIGTDDSKPGSRHHVSYGANRGKFRRCTTCGKRQFSGTPCKCDVPTWIVETPEGPPSSAIRMQRWHEQWAREVFRVLKPGGHLLAFGGTRTSHRMVCAIEDAGFEIRDSIVWLFGSGFPKSHNLPGGIGTALKPAHEPICLARKPLAASSIAANVAAWGTGGLAIDACRIGLAGQPKTSGGCAGTSRLHGGGIQARTHEDNSVGRWPANVALSHTEQCRQVGTAWECAEGCPVKALDEQSGVSVSTGGKHSGRRGTRDIVGGFGFERQEIDRPRDAGGASRFFYVAKASRAEREAGLDGLPERPCGTMEDDGYSWEGEIARGRKPRDARRANFHPTVKPLALMRWLVRLITPPVALVCDMCYNDKHEKHQNVPGMRENFPSKASGADDLLNPVQEQGGEPEQSGRTTTGSTPVQDVWDRVHPEGRSGGVLFTSVPGDGTEEAAPNVRTMRDSVSTGDEESEAPTVLLETVRRPGGTNDHDEAVQGMRTGVLAQEGREQAVLFADVRGPIIGQGEAESQCHDGARVHHALSAGTSDGDQGRLPNGTPADHGGTSRSDANRRRSGASSQRTAERQPSGKPRTDDEAGSRHAAEARAQADHVPSLRGTNRSVRTCPTCGSPLVERPGLILDPFAGSGTTGMAAVLEGFRFVGVEMEAEYVDLARRRIAHAAGQGRQLSLFGDDDES